MKEKKIRVLIADDDRAQSQRLSLFLRQNGFDCQVAADGIQAKTALVNWRPRLVLADLLLPKVNAYDLLRFIQGEPSLLRYNIGLVVLSGHNDPDNMKEAFRRGAKDFIVTPAMPQEVLRRVVMQCRAPQDLKKSAEEAAPVDWAFIENLTAVTEAGHSLEQTLFLMTKILADKLKGVRCSVVRTVTISEGVVIASSDDEKIHDLALDLTKYPEIQLVVNTNKVIAIDNLQASTALGRIRGELKSVDFNSMVVAPVSYKGRPFGVISLRMSPEKISLSDLDVRCVDFVSKWLSLYLSGQSVEDLGHFGLISA